MVENRDDQLAAEALWYACGEMESEMAAAFEARLANEQAARDALVHATELLTPAGNEFSRNYRQAVRRRLDPPPRSLFRRTALSMLAGAAAATLVFVFLDPLGGWLRPNGAESRNAVTVANEAGDPSAEEIYSDLSNVDRLARIHNETMTKRSKQDDLKQHHPVLNIARPMNPAKGSMM